MHAPVSIDFPDSPQPMTRRDIVREAETSSTEDIVIVPPHPLKIKPSGNAYTAIKNLKSAAGLFAALPDELLVQVFECLDAISLVRLGATCRALYAISRLEDLWKTLYLEHFPSIITWRGTWHSTYLNVPRTQLSQIDCSNLFSDVLHRPFLCAHTSLLPYCSNIPAQNCISRLPNLSSEDFTKDWTDVPFILTDPVRKWPVYLKWSTEVMLEEYGKVQFRAEAVDWPLKSYVDYMNNQQDESPLYLFDRAFVEKMGLTVGHKHGGHYWPPECFGEDLFSVLDDQRPDSRWLIVGPERSGSTFHKDPNATSAWNAVLRGSKYWIMFPTTPCSPPPPGVFVSEDQSEVTSPLSIAEWLLGFHAEARKTPGCMEGICHEGEVLHVPSGWWHLVVNLNPSIAITQNFVPEAHLANVLDFLKNKPEQVSGFRAGVGNAYELFMRRMKETHAQLLERSMAAMERMQAGKKRKWDQLVKSGKDNNSDTGGFSFGFGDGDDEDVP